MADSIVGLFGETVGKRGNRPAARFKDDKGGWHTRTWTEMSEDRKVVASGLIALGLEPHERVNILANTSYRWMLCDLGIQSCAGEPVAIYQSNLPHEVQYIIEDCDSVIVFAEDASQVAKLTEVREKIPKIRKVIVMNDEATDGDWIIGWSALEALGQAHLAANGAEIDRRIGLLKPDDVLTLIYTSGTTGPPKGVILTHANLLYTADAVQAIEGMMSEGDVQLLFLPMAHSFAKALQCIWLATGHEMAIDADITQIVPNMAVVKPTVMCSVPRIFEKVYAKVVAKGLESPGAKGKMFKWALGLNDRFAQHAQDGTPMPAWQQLQLNIAKSLVFSKIGASLEETFGGRLRFFISGGAPLSKGIAFFFAHAGVTILEGYGLTETSAATFLNRPAANKIGTVGQPVRATEVKIAQDGEIMIRGGGVMRGYWKKDEATKEVLAPDGWFATGDIGVIDEDGALRITDRKKDIIVTAGGKNVAPQNIEGQIKSASPLISQVMVYGDKRKYLTALITVEPESLAKLAEAGGIGGSYAERCGSAKVREAIQGIIDQVNATLPKYETIKRFHILDKDFEIGDELTPTLKVKRKLATQKYQSLLETMYDEAIVE